MKKVTTLVLMLCFFSTESYIWVKKKLISSLLLNIDFQHSTI